MCSGLSCFGAKSNGDRKFLDSCSTGRAVCICSGHKDVMQSLVLGTFSCYILWYKGACFGGFINDLYTVLGDPENIEMYMSFFLCGGLIIAMKRTGSTKAFTEFVTSKEKGKAAAVMVTAGVYAGATSVDDYVSALTAGAAFLH